LVIDLVQQGNSIIEGQARLSDAVARQTRARRTGNVISVVVVLALCLALLGLWDLQARMCPMVALLRPEVSDSAPATDRARDIARTADRLAADWHCDER